MKEGKECKDARTSRCVEARGCLQQRTMRAALLSVDCEEAEWRRPNPCRREEAHATHPKVNLLIRKLNSHATLMMPPLIFHRSSPRLPRAHYHWHQFRSTFNLRHASASAMHRRSATDTVDLRIRGCPFAKYDLYAYV